MMVMHLNYHLVTDLAMASFHIQLVFISVEITCHECK